MASDKLAVQISGVKFVGAEDDEYGKYCYFPRDLSKGKYGGDVACLQQFLRKEGYMSEETSGYFGSATEAAVIKWQSAAGILPNKGYIGYSSRAAYAKRFSLPTVEELRNTETRMREEMESTGYASGSCIDVCSNNEEVEACEVRCVRDAKDKVHACRAACLDACSKACDLAFPVGKTTTGGQDYKFCLRTCGKTCRKSCRFLE